MLQVSWEKLTSLAIDLLKAKLLTVTEIQGGCVRLMQDEITQVSPVITVG